MNFLRIKLLREVLRLLPKRTPKNLAILLVFQVFVTFLDVLALSLLGILSKSGLDFVQNQRIEIPQLVSKFPLLSSVSATNQLVVLSLLTSLLFVLRTFLSIYGNKRILKYLGVQSAIGSQKLISDCLSSKPNYVVSKKSQELLFGMTIGVDSLVLSYLGAFVLLISELFFILCLTTTLVIAEPLTGTLAILVFGSSGFFIQKMTANRSREMSRRASNLSVEFNQQLLETLSVYRELLLRGKISDATEAIHEKRKNYLALRAELMYLPTLSKYLYEFILVLGGAVVALTQLAINDISAVVSSVVVFAVASSRILPAAIRAQSLLLSLSQAEGTAQLTLQQIDEIRQNLQNLTEPKTVHWEEQTTGPIVVLKDVNFKYDKMGKFSIKNINAEIKSGQFVAIVGESGAGKSTLVDLILGIQEPQNGSLLIQGLPPLVLASLRPGYLAYVPQDITTIDGSIAKNIVLSNSVNYDESKLREVLKKASLEVEVSNLPDGTQTQVGERGIRLSGGQRQRLGIARALYTNPKIIVFDEATSSLDSITEKAVTDSIYTKNSEVTLIVIAHRLSTVRNADLILFLDEGQLIASGTFEEVRAAVPKFDHQAKLVNL